MIVEPHRYREPVLIDLFIEYLFYCSLFYFIFNPYKLSIIGSVFISRHRKVYLFCLAIHLVIGRFLSCDRLYGVGGVVCISHSFHENLDLRLVQECS